MQYFFNCQRLFIVVCAKTITEFYIKKHLQMQMLFCVMAINSDKSYTFSLLTVTYNLKTSMIFSKILNTKSNPREQILGDLSMDCEKGILL